MIIADYFIDDRVNIFLYRIRSLEDRCEYLENKLKSSQSSQIESLD